MTSGERRKLVVEPVRSLHPEIGRALWVLEDSREQTNQLIAQIDPAAVDWEPDWTLNSIGTLLYHVALIEFDWLHVEAMGNLNDEPYPDEILALLPFPARQDNNRLTQVAGVSLAEHRERLALVRRAVLDYYSRITLDAFRKVRTVPEADVTPEWVVYYLTRHETEHRAEMSALVTQYKRLER